MWPFKLHAEKPYRTIGGAEEAAILKTHREYPELGRKRLHVLLRSQGIEVDGVELKRFRSHKIGTPPTRQAIPSFLERHVPTHPWLRYRR